MDASHSPARRAFLLRLAMLAMYPALARCSRSSSGDESPEIPPLLVRPPPPGAEPRLRVRVFRARGPEPAALIGRAQWIRVQPQSPDGDGSEVVLRGPLRIGVVGKGWNIVAGDGAVMPLLGQTLLLESQTPEVPELALEKSLYPGMLRLVQRTPTAEPGAPQTGIPLPESREFDVINLVGMEAYLPGVVAGELFDHWHLQTRAAQAIAARSFAATEQAWFTGRRAWDLTSTEQSQVYRGRVDHGPSRESVEMTRGVMLAFEQRLVSGYYSSCCGGTAANAVDAIGANPINDTPPLRGRVGTDVCTGAKVAQWTVQRPVDELAKRLGAWGKRQGRNDLAAITGVSSVAATSYNDHGRPTRYAVEDRVGSRVEIAAEHLRLAANHTPEGLQPPARPLWSSHVAVTIGAGTATFVGRGHGHGVGLCQYGAQILAREGRVHADIIQWYYPGVELVKAY